MTFYLDASANWVYQLQNLETTIRHYAHLEIDSITDLGDYYRHFLLISWFLIDKGHLSVQKQSRAFLQGLGTNLKAQVRQQLQLKFIDHYPNDPSELKAIYNTTSYVLVCTAATAPKQLRQALNPHSIPNASDPTATTIKALISVVSSLSSMIMTALQTQQVQTDPQGIRAVPTGLNTSGSSLCSFCD